MTTIDVMCVAAVALLAKPLSTTLYFVRLNTSVKTSIKTKRFLAATSGEFRAALLGLAVEGENDNDEEGD